MQRVGLLAGPVVFLSILALVDLTPGDPAPTRMAAVAAWMAIWWISEAIPLAATSLLPLVLYPSLGILTGKQTAPVYLNHVVFLFVGGFLIALAMERWNLHKRIALGILDIVGSSPKRLVLGFLIAAAFLSMWISNTATAILMVAIGLTLTRQIEESCGQAAARPLTVGVMLGVAYGASIGGIVTPVGTPPNLALQRIYEMSVAEATPIGFGTWMLMALPIGGAMLLVTWWLLAYRFFPVPSEIRLDASVVTRERSRLGRLRFAETAVLAVFVATACLWIFRQDLAVGGVVLPGWSRWVPFGASVDDGTVAIAMALTLFLIPARSGGKGGGRLLDGEVFTKIPWGIVLLFGGGFALAKGFQVTGLAAWFGTQATGLEGMPLLVSILSIGGLLTFLTELTSNTATVEMILPVLAAVAESMRIDPLWLMVPATLSASFAFMMPVATPPNAIVFAGGRVRIGEMARVGIVLNLIGVLVAGVLFYTIGGAVLGLSPSASP